MLIYDNDPLAISQQSGSSSKSHKIRIGIRINIIPLNEMDLTIRKLHTKFEVNRTVSFREEDPDMEIPILNLNSSLDPEYDPDLDIPHE